MVATGPSLDRGAGLDGDALLQFAQAQLNELNGDIKAQMAEQQAARKQKQLLTKVRSLLAKYAQTGIDSGDKGAKFEIAKAYAEAISQMQPGANKEALMAQFDQFRSSGFYNNNSAPKVQLNNEADSSRYVWEKRETNPNGLDNDLNSDNTQEADPTKKKSEERRNTLTANEIDAQIKAIDTVGEEIGKDAELRFIDLTSSISKRQTCLQQVTGMMSKIDQGLELVAGNIGK